jgi:hypothetical protein
MAYLKCEECGTTSVRRQGHGLCRNCYMRQYRAKKRKERRAAATSEIDAARAQVVELLAPFLKRYGFSATYDSGRLVVVEQGKRRLDHRF